MKVLILVSLARDSGCWLRAQQFAQALSPHCEVDLVRPMPRCLPGLLDIWLSLPWYLWRVLFSDANVVMGFKPFPNVGLALRAAGRWKGKTTIVDVDDVDHLYFGGWRSSMVRWMQRKTPRRCDLVTYHHPLLQAFLEQHYGVDSTGTYMLRQGVNLQKFVVADSPQKVPLLLFSGHLNIATQLDRIFEAVHLVQGRRQVRFIVAGGGPCLNKFKIKAQAMRLDVEFTGTLEHAEVARYVARATVCLVDFEEVPVNRFRCSMKLREYLAGGKRVVCNRFGEFQEFQPWVYSCDGDSMSFSNAIEKALDGPDGRELEGAEHVRANYDWSKLSERFYREPLSRIVMGGTSVNSPRRSSGEVS